MNIVKEIEGQYDEIDNQYSINEFTARSKGHTKKEAYWKRKKDLNTHAYFLFIFTRLEDHITVESSKLITSKRSTINSWKSRAIWDNTDPGKLHFKKRVGLLTEKGNSTFSEISKYYDLRNEIAHGGTIQNISTAINMVDVFRDMKTYFRLLKK